MGGYKHNRLEVEGKKPTAAEIEVAEIVVNTADETLYSKKADGTVIAVGGGGIGKYIGYSVAISPNDTALVNDTGLAHYNIGIGVNALLTTEVGLYNIGIGSHTLDAVTNGSGNVAIGEQAGGSVVGGGGNVFIGYNAGKNDVANGKLHIANKATESLIHGDFNARTLNFNAVVTANDMPMVISDNTETGTDSVLNMVSCTQAEYDALTPVATTLYVIKG